MLDGVVQLDHDVARMAVYEAYDLIDLGLALGLFAITQSSKHQPCATCIFSIKQGCNRTVTSALDLWHAPWRWPRGYMQDYAGEAFAWNNHMNRSSEGIEGDVPGSKPLGSMGCRGLQMGIHGYIWRVTWDIMGYHGTHNHAYSRT